MELLEREWALAMLDAACDSAARGRGRVVLVSGEPGIGKTWLVRQFLSDLDPGVRVLLGTCDDLSIPRPLGPLRDLTGSVSGALAQALSAGAAAHDIQALLIEELEMPPLPTVLVVEDVHWADDATFDLITVLGRRIGALPAVVVLTFRGGEAPPGHRLRTTIGSIRAEDTVAVELTPLSEGAVTALAGDDAATVYAASGGNPFYVSELLASDTHDELPRSVANAVVGRASRLDEASRRLVELVSVVPSRVKTSLLDSVMPDWAASAEEPERIQLLEVDSSYVRFRHELARNAIQSIIPVAARRRLHAQFLAVMVSSNADPADIVHHAEAAGAVDILADYALIAARRAAALESNREAYSHYRRAAAFVHRRSQAGQAATFEELAIAAYMVNRVQEALEPIERAIELYHGLGDEDAVGRCTRLLSRFHWFAGDGDRAVAAGRRAIVILEPLGESGELARAYSGMSQIAMLANNIEHSLNWGNRALELATRLGDESTRAHALVNLGAAKLMLDPDADHGLVEAHAVAHAAVNRYEATRALVNLGYTRMVWVQPDSALEHLQQAVAYAEEYEVHNLAAYAAATIAWLRMRADEWDEADRIVHREVDKGSDVLNLLARTVLTELAVRRGDEDAPDRLADLTAEADRAGEPQRLVPVIELSTEYALTRGTPMPLQLFDDIVRRCASGGGLVGWPALRIAAWAAVAGIEPGFTGPLVGPFAAMVHKDWLGAADGFGAVGWMYDRALMLSLLDDEASLVESIEIARRLRAAPLTKRVARRLRELDLRVPAGQRETTRVNRAGLTTRQVEVLALVAEGLTNAEIADRLIVSQRTAEHHVAAVLTKLGVATRRDAVRRASELGLFAPT